MYLEERALFRCAPRQGAIAQNTCTAVYIEHREKTLQYINVAVVLEACHEPPNHSAEAMYFAEHSLLYRQAAVRYEERT